MTLGADEKYEIAVAYGTIVGTGLLAIVVCLTRVCCFYRQLQPTDV